MATSFSPGRRWLCTPKGRARFWFVILGPGTNNLDKPAPNYKRCRIEIHPDDKQLAGANLDGVESTYSHKHLKKHAVLEPIEKNTLAGWAAIIEEQGNRGGRGC